VTVKVVCGRWWWERRKGFENVRLAGDPLFIPSPQCQQTINKCAFERVVTKQRQIHVSIYILPTSPLFAVLHLCSSRLPSTVPPTHHFNLTCLPSPSPPLPKLPPLPLRPQRKRQRSLPRVGRRRPSQYQHQRTGR